MESSDVEENNNVYSLGEGNKSNYNYKFIYFGI